MNASFFISAVGLMYLMSIVVGVMSYLCSRGPDGNLTLFFPGFIAIGVVYCVLAWVSRQDAIWIHYFGHLVVFLVAVTVGMWPRPRLDEMAGILYMFTPAAVVATVAAGALVRLVSRMF
jgi:hypothetical protein